MTGERRRRWLLPAAMAGLAAFGLVTLVAISGSASSGNRLPKGLALPSPGVLRSGWVRVSKTDADIEPGSVIAGVVWGPGGFVAVGGTGARNGARIWTSPTGRKWTQVPTAELPAPDAVLMAVGWIGPRLLTVGSSGPNGSGAIVWRSDDGSHWVDETRASSGLPAGWTVNGLVRSGAVAIAYGAPVASGSPPAGAIWTSPDGLRWDETPVPGVVAGMVAVGTRLAALVEVPSAHGREDVTFTSPDGRSWTAGSDLGASRDPGSETLSLWQGQAVALTYPTGNAGAGAVWRSSDGVTWRGPTGLGPEIGSGIVDALTTIGPYVVATGADATGVPGAWVSAYGSTFVSRPGLGAHPGGTLNRTATDGTTLVAFGTAPELSDVYLWRVPASDRSDLP